MIGQEGGGREAARRLLVSGEGGQNGRGDIGENRPGGDGTTAAGDVPGDEEDGDEEMTYGQVIMTFRPFVRLSTLAGARTRTSNDKGDEEDRVDVASRDRKRRESLPPFIASSQKLLSRWQPLIPHRVNP